MNVLPESPGIFRPLSSSNINTSNFSAPVPTLEGMLTSEIIVSVVLASTLVLLAKRWKTSGLPPPNTFPLIGGLRSINHPWRTYLEWSRKYDSDIIYDSGLIVVNSAKAAKALFDPHGSASGDRPKMVVVREMLGLNWHFAFHPASQSHTQHRKLFVSTFSSASANRIRFIKYSEQWEKIFLKNLLQTGKGQKFALRNSVQHFVSGLSLHLTHGLCIQPLGTPDPFVQAAETALDGLSSAGLYGTWSLLIDRFPVLQHLYKLKKMPEWRKAVDVAASVPFDVGVANLQKKKSDEDRELPPSILEDLLSAHPSEDEKEHIHRTTAAMYANGSAAMVPTLLTFFLAMALYPEAQRRAQAELDTYISANHLESKEKIKVLLETVDLEDKLPYSSSLVKEVLRWRPAVPLAFPHQLSGEETYEGMRLPKNTVVLGNAWAILHDPEIYGSQYDVDEFEPLRFLQTSLDIPAAFGFGKRACPARYMAQSTLFRTVVSVLSCFTISSPSTNSLRQKASEYTSGLISYPPSFECVVEPRTKAVETEIHNW